MMAHQNSAARQRDRLLLVAYASCAVLLTSLPIYAWQVVLFAAVGTPSSKIVAPLWYLLALSALAWLMGFAGRDLSRVTMFLISIAPVALAYTLLASYAPVVLGGGDFATEVLLQLQLLANGPMLSPMSYILLLLVAFVWSLGMSDGAATARFRPARATRRVAASLGATMLASGVILRAPSALQGETAASVMISLSLVVIAGLLLLALTRGFNERETPGVDPIFLASQGRQFGWAALVAAGAALVALTITFAASPQNIIAFLTSVGLRPFIHTIVGAIEALLAWLASLLHMPNINLSGNPTQPSPPGFTLCQLHPKDLRCKKVKSTPLTWLLYLVWLMLAATLVAILIGLARVFVRRPPDSPGDGPEEERESLDSWKILREQVRSALRSSLPRHDNRAYRSTRALCR